MNKFFTTILFLSFSLILQAEKIDLEFFKKITGTKWELMEEKKLDGLFPRKNKNPVKETITFSDGSILFDLPDAHYACNFTIKNKFEYWLTCAEPDQYIYKIHSLNNRKLVMDVFVKTPKGNFIRKKRLTYHILLA
jgi:hypothetical protein